LLLGLVEKVRPGSTFWMVGDQSLLAGMPTSVPAPGATGNGATISLPALQALTVTGDLDPQLSLNVIGDAKDELAAKNLADVVARFVALMSLQSQQKPELQQLASAFTVATEANRVLVLRPAFPTRCWTRCRARRKPSRRRPRRSRPPKGRRLPQPEGLGGRPVCHSEELSSRRATRNPPAPAQRMRIPRDPSSWRPC